MLRKKITTLILASVLCLGLMACGSNENETAQETTIAEEETATAAEDTTSSDTKIVVDHADREVEIPTEINRIVMGSVYPMPSVLVTYLGSAEKIVGIDPVSMSAAENGLLGQLYPEILNADTSYLEGGELNVEQVLALNPDIFIGATADQAEVLEQAGIPTIVVSPSKFDYDILETYNQWIALLDQIFGESEVSKNIEAYSDQIAQEISDVAEAIPEEEKQKVLIVFQYDDETLITSGKNFFGQYWCDAVGAINVAAELDDVGSVQISMEQVYEWDPDVIIITNFTSAQPEDILNNTIGNDDWSNISAVKNNRVYKFPLGIYRTFTPGADTPVTLQWFAKTVYPDLYADKDMTQITKDYFSDMFGFTLTDDQIDTMYNPAREAANGL